MADDGSDFLLDLDLRRHASEIGEMWQAKVLRAAEDKIYLVVLSILADAFDDAMPVLMRVVYPGFISIVPPFLVSSGKIVKTGHVCADMIMKDGRIEKLVKLFRNELEFERDMRRLADQAELSDDDRRQFFIAANKWIVCDYRLDPNMDRRDPDAKRLTVH